MDYQPRHSRRDQFLNYLITNGIGLAYFFGSQKDLGPRLLAGEDVQGAPESDLDLGVVMLTHPLDYWEGQRLRKQLENDLAPLFAPNIVIGFARIEGREIAYHFDLDGVVLTVTTCVDNEPPMVPSITPWFKNADWNEREFMELYGIKVENHPNPRRLFIDKDLDAGQLDKLIPLSTMMNGASTKTLWEKVFSGMDMPKWAKEAK